MPNGAGQYICDATRCVDSGGVCTNNADCCTGISCTIPAGAASGICGGIPEADGGVLPPPADAGSSTDAGADSGTATCGRYGQVCVDTPDCCIINGTQVPCTGGRCLFP